MFLAAEILSAAGMQAAKPARPSQVDELNRRAAAAMAASRFDEAIPLLEQLVKLQPRSPEVLANLGLAYYSTSRYDKAAENYRQALKLDPQLPHAGAFLGIAEAEAGHYQEALPYLEKAFASEKDKELKRMVGINLEQLHVAMRKPLRAAEVVQVLLRDHPDDPDVLYIATRLYFQLSSILAGRMIEVAPTSFRARQLAGDLLEAHKQYAPAAVQYRKAVALAPNASGLHYRLGLMLIRSSNEPAAWEEARQAFEAELRIDPTHARCYVELAEILRKQGKLDDAEKLFERGLALNADLPEAHAGLGRIQAARGNLGQALEQLREAVRMAPDSEVAQFELSQVLSRLGRKEEARQVLTVYEKLRADRLEKTDNLLYRLDRAEEDSPPAP
ncbi:MAG: tetratricopeptide repeat protein [Terriglobia bacterium]